MWYYEVTGRDGVIDMGHGFRTQIEAEIAGQQSKMAAVARYRWRTKEDFSVLTRRETASLNLKSSHPTMRFTTEAASKSGPAAEPAKVTARAKAECA